MSNDYPRKHRTSEFYLVSAFVLALAVGFAWLDGIVWANCLTGSVVAYVLGRSLFKKSRSVNLENEHRSTEYAFLMVAVLGLIISKCLGKIDLNILAYRICILISAWCLGRGYSKELPTSTTIINR